MKYHIAVQTPSGLIVEVKEMDTSHARAVRKLIETDPDSTLLCYMTEQ